MEQVQTMRAVGFNRFGPAEVLETFEVAKPIPAPDEVLIKVAAAGINPADWRFRNGQFRFFMTKKRPFICGADVAGVVVEVGTAVTKFKPGDAVYGLLPIAKGGGYAEFAVLSEKTAARVAPNLTLAEAAAVPLVGLTALQGLRDKVNLQPGQSVLIYGASGGVGTFAIQIARALGATVTGVCSAKNMALVGSLGADQVLDYNSRAFTELKAQYDVVFDAVNYFSFARARRLLRPKGLYLTVNPVGANPLAQLKAALQGSQRPKSVFVQSNGADLAVLSDWIADGKVRPVVEQQYPLSGAAQAQHYSETGHVRGKLVLLVDEGLANQRAEAVALQRQ